MSVVALDIGSSRIKVLLARWDGAVRAVRSVPTPVRRGADGEWAYPADEVLDAAASLVAGVASEHPGDVVDTIVFSCLGTAMVPVDVADRPLGTALSPADTRPADDPDLLDQVALSAEQLWHMTGSDPAVASFLLHYLWWQRRRPDVLARVHRFRSLRGFIVRRLCGADAEDPSWASRTMLLDLDEPDRWSPSILTAAGLSDRTLPAIEPSTASWSVLPAAAERFGLAPDATVVLGAIDNGSSLLGATDPAEPRLAVIVGTYEHVAGSGDLDLARAASGSAGGVVHVYPVPGQYLAMTRVPIGLLLSQVAASAGVELEALLADVSPEPQGHELDLDPGAVADALDDGMPPGRVIQALLESAAGVLKRFADAWAATGHQTEHLSTVGGGSAGGSQDHLIRLRANVLGRTLSVLEIDQGAGYGALRLAAMSVQGASVAEACELFPNPVKATWTPDPA